MEREAWLILALVSVPETKYLTHWPFTFEKKIQLKSKGSGPKQK